MITGTASPTAEAAKDTLAATTQGKNGNGHSNGVGNGTNGANGIAALGAGLTGADSQEMQVAAGANEGGNGDQLSTRPPDARRDTTYKDDDNEEIAEAGKSWLTGKNQLNDADPTKKGNEVVQRGEETAVH